LSRRLGRCFRRDIIWANAPPPGHNMLLLGVVTSTGLVCFPDSLDHQGISRSTYRLSSHRVPVCRHHISGRDGVGLFRARHDRNARSATTFSGFRGITTVPPGPFFFDPRSAASAVLHSTTLCSPCILYRTSMVHPFWLFALYTHISPIGISWRAWSTIFRYTGQC
jgi:hypothetical protein